MGDTYSSPIDPLFWLHHAQLDRIWANWQEGAPGRLSDIGGPLKPCWGTGETTLETVLWMGYIAPSKPIASVMDTRNRDGSGILCYEYA